MVRKPIHLGLGLLQGLEVDSVILDYFWMGQSLEDILDVAGLELTEEQSVGGDFWKGGHQMAKIIALMKCSSLGQKWVTTRISWPLVIGW